MKYCIYGVIICMSLCCPAQVVHPQGIRQIADRHIQIFYPEFAHSISTGTTYASESWRVMKKWYIWVNSVPRNSYLFKDNLFPRTSTPCAGDPSEDFPQGPCLPRFMPQDNEVPGLLFQAVIYLSNDRSSDYVFHGSSTATSKKNIAFGKLLHQHPEWTDAQRAAQLAEAGGKFGPNDKTALLSSDTIKRIRTLLGPYHIKHAEFLWYTDFPFPGWPGGTKKVEATFWQIDAIINKSHRNYTFIIEPMAGELTEMFATPPPQRKTSRQHTSGHSH